MLSPFSCVQLFVTLWTPARQAPLSMEFSRQEYWSRVSCLLPVDLFDPGTEPGSPELAGGFFTTNTNRMPYYWFFNLSLLTPPSFSAKLLPILPVLVSFFHDYYTHTPLTNFTLSISVLFLVLVKLSEPWGTLEGHPQTLVSQASCNYSVSSQAGVTISHIPLLAGWWRCSEAMTVSSK